MKKGNPRIIKYWTAVLGGLNAVVAIMTTLFSAPLMVRYFFVLLGVVFINIYILLYKKNKLKYHLLVILLGLLGILLIRTHEESRLKLVSIQVDEQRSLWMNSYGDDGNQATEVIEFKENTVYLWNKWRWLPKPVGNYEYDGKKQDRNLRKVFEYLKGTPIQRGATPQICPNIADSLFMSDYSHFRQAVVWNYVVGGGLFACLKSIWPSPEQVNEISNYDMELWEALKEFELDFFRDKHPIFNIIIENHIPHDVLLIDAELQMRHLFVDTSPAAYGGTALTNAGQYDWKLENMSYHPYQEWFANLDSLYPFGFRRTYSESLPNSYHSFSPALVVPQDGFLEFSIRFVGGYRWPCEIRFIFNFNDGRSTHSKWLKFYPTSHPTINIFQYY